MARPRAGTGGLGRDDHSVSLKVLRLSKPSLAEQSPLPQGSTANISHVASLAYPAESVDQDFILSSNLALPPAFGSAYVGETFSCALCASTELTAGTKSVSALKMVAEMATPTAKFPLPLLEADTAGKDTDAPSLRSFLSKIIRFDLKEEGSHTLSVNISYTETSRGEGSASAERSRTLRKMYQFQAQPCLSVRTKATELAPNEVPDKIHGPFGRTQLLRYVLEAQLENVSSTRIVLEQAVLKTEQPFKNTSLQGNDNGHHGDRGFNSLNPRDILQVAFLIEQQEGVTAGLEELKASLKQDGRVGLGQIALQWRSEMGEKGELSTGSLLTRRK